MSTKKKGELSVKMHKFNTIREVWNISLSLCITITDPVHGRRGDGAYPSGHRGREAGTDKLPVLSEDRDQANTEYIHVIKKNNKCII